jgi:O-acetylhomoserine/O-acetylserine sulfhydrylase-like pyridoxal-dependent enzyme
MTDTIQATTPAADAESATGAAQGTDPLDELAPGVRRAVEIGAAATADLEARRAAARGRRFDTIAVHGVYSASQALAAHGAINEPLYLSTAQHHASADAMEAVIAQGAPGWVYARVADPTNAYLEETLALLETYGSEVEATAMVTASGMAATAAATQPFLVEGGPAARRPNIVASARCYGGTFVLFTRYAAELGVEVRWVRDPLDTAAWSAAIDGDTRFVFGETPSNPGLAIVDVPAVAAIAHAAGLPFIVDSTVATPALLRPLTMGADVVVQSLTKTIGGSGMAIAGAVIARKDIPSRVGDDGLRADYGLHLKSSPLRDHGATLSPFAALMLLNDLRTLRARVDHWSRTAEVIARTLAGHPAIESVAYPGLPAHPGHDIAARDMWLADGDVEGRPVNRFGSLMGFRVKGGREAARAAFDRLELVWRATDLGRVKTIATIPMISTHQQQGPEGREIAAIPDDLIRLSVGGEHPDDILADLDQALRGIDR